MKLRRRPSAPSGRQRVRPENPPPRPAQNYSSGSRRSDTESNTGRQLPGTARQSFNYYMHRLGLIILLLAVAASLTNLLTLSARPKVLPLGGDKSSPFLRDASVYEVAAGKLLAASVWNKNKVTVDAGGISQSLTDEFPELSGATMTIPLASHRPVIYVRPAKPVIILSARNGSFIVANTGKALLRGSSVEELARFNLPPVSDQSGLKLQVGRQALSGDDVKFIQSVKTQLSAKGYGIASMTLPPNATELDVQPAGQAYTIKFNLHSRTARRQAGTFLAAIDYLKKHNAAPAKYVDVRVDGRAYYQ